MNEKGENKKKGKKEDEKKKYKKRKWKVIKGQKRRKKVEDNSRAAFYGNFGLRLFRQGLVVSEPRPQAQMIIRINPLLHPDAIALVARHLGTG